jgi:DNA-binding MarR family transcriptional regulator
VIHLVKVARCTTLPEVAVQSNSNGREPRALAADPAASLGFTMVAICRLTEIALMEAELSLSEYRILHHVSLGRTIQSDLAFHLAVSKQSVTRLVDPLVDKRYIKRLIDPEDRRRVIHSLTTRGKRVLVRTDTILEKYLMLILQDLPVDADIGAAKAGLRLVGEAAITSYQRVHPDGIVPGRLSAQLIKPKRIAPPS